MQAVTRILLVWRLLLSNSSTLVKISLYVVPIAMLLTIWVSLTLDGLVQLYIKRLELAYAGMQGRLSIQADPYTINEFNKGLSQNGVKVLLRHDKTHLIELKQRNGDNIKKFVTLVVFEDDAYTDRFNTDSDNSIIINQILSEQLGAYSKQLAALKYYKNDNWLKIDSLAVIDTGFLTNKALLFIQKTKYEYILKSGLNGFTKLEIADASLVKVDKIKVLIDEIAINSTVGSYKLNDILLDTADARQQFSKLRMVQLALLVLVLSLSALTITYAVKLLLVLKVKALSIMNRLGLARHDLSLALISAVTGVFLMMTVLGYYLHQHTFQYVLQLVNIPASATVDTDTTFYILIVALLLVIGFVAAKSSKEAVLVAP